MTEYINKRKWKNFLIRNDIQIRIALYNLFFLFIVMLLVIMATLVPLYIGFENTDNLWTQHFSGKFFIILIDRLLIVSFLILITGFVFNLIITHRFCGPLVSFSKTFQKMKRGDLTRKVYLRRYDYLKPEAAQVNELIDIYSNHLNVLKQNNLLLEENLLKLDKCNQNGTEDNKYFNQIRKIINANQGTLDQFKTIETRSRSSSNNLAN